MLTGDLSSRPVHPFRNEESFEMDELNDEPASSTEQELMPKAVMEGEADSLSSWAWLSAIWYPFVLIGTHMLY